MGTIADSTTINNEIVLSERVVASEFVIVEIHEFINLRRVQVEIELGPFTTEEMPNGTTFRRGISRRGVTVWENDDYDAVRDTWKNDDLIARVSSILNG